MLGLQTQHDIQNVSRLTAAESNTRRSHKFATHLSKAGFAVPGQSNSMRKHTETTLSQGGGSGALTKERKRNLNSQLAQDQFIQKQDLETQNDARKLAELEAQLAEIHKQKELRRARDRARRMKRMQYMAACTIVRALRYFTKTRKAEALTVVQDFLLVVKNRNAITVATWAATCIGKWAKITTKRWQFLRLQRIALAAAKADREEKQRIKDAANQNARNVVGKTAVVSVLRTAMVAVAKAEITKRREQSRKDRAKNKGWKSKQAGSTTPAKPKSSSIASSSASPSPTHKDSSSNGNGTSLFITTTEGGGNNNGEGYDGEAGPDTTSELIGQARKNFVPTCNIPGVPSVAANAGGEMGMDLDFTLDLGGEEVYDEDAEIAREHRERIEKEHAILENKRNKERELRLRALAIKKMKDAELAFKQRNKEREELERKEDARLDWLQEQEDKAIAKAQYLTSKRKRLEKDNKRATKENIIMGTHDLRTIERDAAKKLALENPIPKRKPKKIREPSEYEIQFAELQRIEAEEAKEKAAEALYIKNKEATEKRLRDAADKREEEKEREAATAKLKAEKVASLELARKSALKKALAAKKIKDKHAKQLEKEKKILDLKDKAPSGRTHNAFGKPLAVKGFVGPVKVKDSNSVGKAKNRKNENITGGVGKISSHVAVKDPNVHEWNYAVKPAGDNADADGDNTSQLTNNSSFQFDDFLTNAAHHSMLDIADDLMLGADGSSSVGGEEYWPFGEESNDEDGDEDVGEDLDESLSRDTKNKNNSKDCVSAIRGSDEKENAGEALIKATEGSNSIDARAANTKVNGKASGIHSMQKGYKSKIKPTLREQPRNPNIHAHDNINHELAQGVLPPRYDKKTKVTDIMGGSHIRQPKIPVGLKDTPYFKSYVATTGLSNGSNSSRTEDSAIATAKATNKALKAQLAAAEIGVGVHPTVSVSLAPPVSGLGNLMSPLDMPPPEAHPLLAKQTKAIRAPMGKKMGDSGKVAALHAMVAKARSKVGVGVGVGVDVSPESGIQKPKNNTNTKSAGDGSKGEGEGGRLAIDMEMQPFRPPPPDLDIQIDSPSSPNNGKNNTDVGGNDEGGNNDNSLDGSLCDYFFASRVEGEGNDGDTGLNSPPSIFNTAAGRQDGNHFPSPPNSRSPDAGDNANMSLFPQNQQYHHYDVNTTVDAIIDANSSHGSLGTQDTSFGSGNTTSYDDNENENDNIESVAMSTHEAALNAECDMLRLRLEAKLGTTGGTGGSETGGNIAGRAGSSLSARGSSTEAGENQQGASTSSGIGESASEGRISNVAVAPPTTTTSIPVPVPIQLRKSLAAKDFLISNKAAPSKNNGDSSRGANNSGFAGDYKIDMQMPDFSLNLLQQWADEDDREEPSPVRQDGDEI